MSGVEGRLLCRSGRLTVRRLGEGDLEELYGLLSDPEVMVFLEPPYTYGQTKDFLRTAGLGPEPLVYGVDGPEGRFIGYVIFHRYDRDSVELGWVLKRTEWGKGYAGELTRLLLEAAGDRYAEAVIECVPEQEVTRHIALKNGFRYEGSEDGCERYRRRLGMELVKLREKPELAEKAARWFHEKWNIPLEAYEESMGECLKGTSPVPQWYLALEGERIVGGLGVIENDFHDRKDLTPNVCAVYVEEEYRCRGIAGRLLELACRDMKELGTGTLYLLTDHDSFYERYGWAFFCMAQGDGEETPSRMYVHRET